MRCAARVLAHAHTFPVTLCLPAGLQRPKESDVQPKVAADENPYGAKPMSLVLRMNRAEQNAGDFKVRLFLSPTR